jgi:hypothetical protein
MERYGLKERTAHSWLYCKLREGLFDVDKREKVFRWIPTKKAENFAKVLDSFYHESKKINS